MARRKANAKWEGSITEGAGTMALGSSTWEGPYTYKSRFEDGAGTNPEELIGAAHAGCFTMALTVALGQAGHQPGSIDTGAEVRVRQVGGGFEIDRIDLTTRARVPGIDAEELTRLAQAAKEQCPVSKALASVGEINLDAQLVD